MSGVVRRRAVLLGALKGALLLSASPVIARSASAMRPLVIAHRGASGYRPEHSEAAYRLAIAMGADYIEPDLVMTKDGVLVARHENEIGRTTDVADHPEFADRRTTKTISGFPFTGWFVEDFTLAELKTLRTRERNPEIRPDSARYDREQPVLTLQEIINIVRDRCAGPTHPVGLYIELKDPDYHREIGLPMEDALLAVLRANDLDGADAQVVIQSFWPSALMALGAKTQLRLCFLLNSVAPPDAILRANGIERYEDVYSPAGLRQIATFANIVGPETGLVLPLDDAQRTGEPTAFIANAHAAGLKVHIWSVNAENAALPADYRRGDPTSPDFGRQLGDATGLARRLYALGADGLFSDHPDLVAAARETLQPG